MSPERSGGWPLPAEARSGWPGPVTDQRAAWALALAIFAFIVPVLPAIGALALAAAAHRRIAGSWGRDGDDLVRSARVLAMVNLLLAAAAVVTALVFVALDQVSS